MRLRENWHMVPRSAWVGMGARITAFLLLFSLVVCKALDALMRLL